jgi:hypothetical protein
MGIGQSSSRRSAIRAWRAVGIVVLAAGAVVGQAQAAEAASEPRGTTLQSDRAEVSYRNTSMSPSEVGQFPDRREEWLADLSNYILAQAARAVPQGQRLSVTLTDVRLAGMYEPWRGPAWSNVRVVRDTTPPRIDLIFRLETSQGAVLKEGSRSLRDIDFLNSSLRYRGEALSYEKSLVDDWMRKEIASSR